MTNIVNNLVKGFKIISAITIFGIIMLIIESFYPLGNYMHNNFGLFADFIGNVLGFITLIGISLWIGIAILGVLIWKNIF